MVTRRRVLQAMGGGLATLALAPGVFPSPRAQSETIRIGHQAPLTGAVAAFGKWHNRALRAAIERINVEGGIAGRPLILVTEDSASTPEAGVDAFRKLVLQHGVDHVIGSVWSGTNLATAPLARELEILYFPQGIATEITGRAGNRFGFKSYHNVRAAVRAGAQWAVSKLGTRWTIIASELKFAQSQAADWQAELKRLGAGLMDVITVPFRPLDFVTFLGRLDLKRTDVLYQAFTAVDTARFLRAAHELGVHERVKILGLIEGIDVLDTRSPAFAGTYYLTSYPRRSDEVPEDLKTYDRIYRSAVGIDDEGFSSEGEGVVPIADLFGSWQALSLLKAGIEASDWRSRRDNPALIEALEGLSWAAGPDFPQGAGFLRSQDHLAFHDHYLERVEDGALTVIVRIPKERSLYEPPADYAGDA